jgi:hypothetical protein
MAKPNVHTASRDELVEAGVRAELVPSRMQRRRWSGSRCDRRPWSRVLSQQIDGMAATSKMGQGLGPTSGGRHALGAV